MGVNIETEKTLGEETDIAGLLAEGYDAVFLAVGGWDSRLARTGGRGEKSPAPGCHLLIDVAKAGSPGYPELKLSGHVVIVGNTHVTMAMIQRCKSLGAEKVTLMVREPGMTDIDGNEAEIFVDCAINRAVRKASDNWNRLKLLNCHMVISGRWMPITLFFQPVEYPS